MRSLVLQINQMCVLRNSSGKPSVVCRTGCQLAGVPLCVSVPEPTMSSDASSPLSPGSPQSPLSPGSLQLPECGHTRERCPSPTRGFLIPSPLPTRRSRTYSAIEGEYVPVEGDEVSYKLCSIPPKMAKVQAVEVTITHLAPGTKHETWSGHVISS
ncbi:calcium-regulated heat-stable protein 1-like isoform X2 [Polyodon spathula]|uniref:calcium-regulated heat-stable protein 1-like isoform X2 n=1 Tax=Polyodon spathula TaxID=7913 RepID=UPI001B7EC5B5|nr:calcium-regulated heat-stable protein 1-like isoform X2 [Polyodon spathula]